MHACIALMFAVIGISASTATFQQPSAPRLPLNFEGNRVFSSPELLTVTDQCLVTYSKTEGTASADALDYCLNKLKFWMFAKGYLQAKLGKLQKHQTPTGLKITVPIQEGILYRLGDIEFQNSRLFTPAQLRQMLKLRTGDVADADVLSEWAYKILRKVYAEHGYLQYSAELNPNFRGTPDREEGIVDFIVDVDEGDIFKIRSIRFEGNGNIPTEALLQAMLLRADDVFNQRLFEDSLTRVSLTGQFEAIDPDKDVEFRADKKSPVVDLTIHLKRKT